MYKIIHIPTASVVYEFGHMPSQDFIFSKELVFGETSCIFFEEHHKAQEYLNHHMTMWSGGDGMVVLYTYPMAHSDVKKIQKHEFEIVECCYV